MGKNTVSHPLSHETGIFFFIAYSIIYLTKMASNKKNKLSHLYNALISIKAWTYKHNPEYFILRNKLNSTHTTIDRNKVFIDWNNWRDGQIPRLRVSQYKRKLLRKITLRSWVRHENGEIQVRRKCDGGVFSPKSLTVTYGCKVLEAKFKDDGLI